MKIFVQCTAVRRNWLKKRNTGSNFHFAFLAQWQIWRLYREYCLPFIKKGGRLVSYKSGEVADELKNAEKAIKILGGERQQPIYFNLPGTDIQRSFIIIKKTETTPKKYPRKAGTPSKQPLGVEIIEKK